MGMMMLWNLRNTMEDSVLERLSRVLSMTKWLKLFSFALGILWLRQNLESELFRTEVGPQLSLIGRTFLQTWRNKTQTNSLKKQMHSWVLYRNERRWRGKGTPLLTSSFIGRTWSLGSARPLLRCGYSSDSLGQQKMLVAVHFVPHLSQTPFRCCMLSYLTIIVTVLFSTLSNARFNLRLI